MRGIILGAGITGLSAGIKTGFPIYEATDKPGGICRSYTKAGYRFENGGGHWIFGSDKMKQYIESFVDLNHFDRKASVYFNQFIDYPIQKFFEDEDPVNPETMKSWMRGKFGNELCRLFFYPFNHKYTDGLYDQIIQDDPAKSPDPRGQGYNDRFSYPNEAGLDKLIDRMANDQVIHYNKKLTAINVKDHLAMFEGGQIVQYDKLISTIPLKELLRIAGVKCPDLKHTSVLVLNIGAERGPNCPGHHWIYIPDPKCAFFRVGFYSNVDPSFAPSGKVSIYVERAFAEPKDLSFYVDEVIHKLTSWGWISKVDITDHSMIPYGYTWVTPGHERDAYLSWLLENDVISTGRYGKWKFQGIVDSIQDGMEVAP